MFKNLKKYRKLLFLFMILFISSFLGVNKVEAATALKSGKCVINSAGEYYLGESYKCNYFYINASNVTLELNGYTLSVNEQFVVSKNLRNVTIQDSKKTGVIQSVSSTQKKLSTIRIATNSRVNIIGGSYYNKTNLGAIFSLDGVTFEEWDNGNYARLDLKGVHAEMNFSDIEYSQEVQKNSRDSIIKYNGYASGGSTCNIYAVVNLRGEWGNRSIYINNVGGNSRIASGENSNCKVKTSALYFMVYSQNNVKSASGKILKFFTDENEWLEEDITYELIGEDGKSTRLYRESYTHGIGKELSYVPPVPAGYVFTGWYNAPDLKTIDEKYKIEKITETDIGNVWVYTKFELKPYNINYYNGNTKITDLTPSTYKMGDTVTLPTYSARGYTFGGWYTDKNYKTKVTTITSSSTGDKTYYAKMTPNTYSISYYDGNTKITNLTPTSYKYGTGVTLPTYSKTGYVFEGWYSDSALTKKVTSISKTDIGNKTYYAKMVKSTYSITYYNGNTKITNLTPTTYTYTLGATLPTYSVKGYTFNGWYTDKNYTTKVTSISKTDIGNKTYYAKMTANTYKISYYDGDIQLTNLTPTTYTYAVGATLPTYSKVGYTFKGWSTSKEGTNIITKISTSDIENKVLYAVFDANEYKVNYVLNGGVNNSKNPQSYVYNSNQFKLLDGSTLSAVATSLKDASKEGYTLQGWYDNENFTGEKVTAIATIIANDQTYYAKWTPNMYTITLDDTIGNTKTIKGIYDSKLQNVEPITRIGYTFDGYATKKGEKYFNANGENTKAWNIAEDTNLYAQWIPNDQTITWIDGNGNVIYSGNAKYDDMPVYDESKYGLPIKDADFEAGVGYVFKGWSPEITTVTGDATYTALFEEVDSFDIKYYYGKVLLTGLTPESYKVSVETELPTEIPGYTFDGWYLEDYLKTKIEKISKTTSGDITLYAKPLSVYRDDYVYDNLILHLDGIDHGSVTGIWEDLSKNNNDVILSPNHIFGKNKLESNKLTSMGSSSKTKSVIFESNPDEFTIELVSEFNSEQDGVIAAIKNSTAEATGFEYYQTSGSQKIEYYTTTVTPNYEYNNKIKEKTYRTITYNKTNNTLKVYEDGELLETIPTSEINPIISNMKLQLGGVNWDSTLNLDGAIYSVRIYDAELTDEQIKQNYETDKERFDSDIDYQKDDLVIYLDGKNKGNTEGIWQDLSGNGNHGTINGATYNGKDGFTFDGINDYVDFGKQHFYEDVTLEALITPNEIDKYRSIFTSQDGGGYALTISSNAIGATSHIGGSYTNMSVDYTNNKKMVHLTYTVGNGYEKLYLDGVLVKAQEINGTIKGPGSLYTKLTLGANNNAAADGSTSTYTEHFYGTIHTARVYKRALTEGEVLENYKLDKEKYNPDTDYVRNGMVIYLDGTNKGNTEGIWQDLSGNNNHGTIKGATYNGEDGFEFDGTDDYVAFDEQHFYENITMEVAVSIDKTNGSNAFIMGNLDGGGTAIYATHTGTYIGADIKVDGNYQNVRYPDYKTNKIIYITFTLDGKYQKFYVDGKLVDTNEITGTLESPVLEKSMMTLGANPPEPLREYLDGTIYAARVYNRALTASEVKQNYNLDKDKYSSDNYIEDDLVIHLDGTNKGDTEGIWQDLSGNGNHGTINGATYNGVNGFEFDGTDDYVAFDDQHFYENVTMEAVVSIEDLSKTSSIIAAAEDGGYVILSGSNVLLPEVYVDGTWTKLPYDKYTPGDLVHIAYTIDSSYHKLYIDGVLVASSKITGTITGPDSSEDIRLSVGANHNIIDGVEKYQDLLDGTIYDIKLYNRALTESEVKQNYDIDKDKYTLDDYVEDDLVIHLDGTNKGDTEGIWQDISGNGNHGTINGATYNGKDGFEFDGTDDYVKFGEHNYPFVTMEVVFKSPDLKDKYSTLMANWENAGYGLRFDYNTLYGLVILEDENYQTTEFDYNKELITATLTYDGTNIKLYKNGELVNTKEAISTGIPEPFTFGSYTGDFNLFLGAQGSYSDKEYVTDYFDGTIYGARLYTRALTEEEIKQNYASDKDKYKESDLILHLDGTNKGTTNGIWKDLSGNGNHGTINGATYNGVNGFEFDGTDDYVAFDDAHFYENITLEILATPKDLIAGDGEDTDGLFTAQYQGGHKIGFYLPNPTLQGSSRINNKYYYVRQTPFANNKTVHVTYTADSSYQRLYVDGVLIEEKEVTGTVEAPADETKLAIGATYRDNNYVEFFTGTVYDAKLYSRALTADEVAKNYDDAKEKYGIEDDLIIHLDGTNKGNTEGVWEDLSGNGNHGTISGATWNGDHLSFDGNSYVSFNNQHFYENVTMEVLVNPKDLSKYANIISNVDGGGYGLEVTTNSVYSTLNIDGTYQMLYYDTTDADQLIHMIYTLDGTYEKLYINGKLHASHEITGIIKAPGSEASLALGANPNADSSGNKTYAANFNGDIYMMRMYTRAINENEVKANYTEVKSKFINDYKIHYYNGALKLEGIEPSGYEQNETVELGTTEIDGYTLEGWYTSETFDEGTKKTQIETSDSGDIKVYGNFVPNKYTVSFESNGGSEVESITADYGTQIVLPTPTKENYDFIGWYTSEEFTEEATTDVPLGDKTYYAKWEPKTYNINYYSGLIKLDMEPSTYTYGVGATLPTEVPGYTFGGWYTTSTFDEGTEVTEITTTDALDKILYAKLSVQQFTISFEENGGTEIVDITGAYGTPVTEPSKPTKENYVFGGWYVDEELTTPYQFSIIPAVNLTLYAKWNGLPQRVTWLNADGTEIYSEEVEYGSIPVYDEETYKVPVNDAEIEEGYEYTFTGWDKEIVEVTEDISYTASFEKTPIVYNISYYVGDITLSGVNPNTYTYGEGAVLPELDLTGYKSSGWYTSPTFESDTKITEITATSIGDITVYAKINTDEYTISFEENGGTEVADITKLFDEVIEKPEDPTRENYIFEGWYLEPEFITEYEFTTMPGVNMTLYAKWSGVPHKITWLNKDDVEIYSSEVEYGSIPDYDEETYGIPTYEKIGYTYTFKGWEPEIVEVTGEATYKAVYEEVANTYNITYYNGENIIDDIEPNSYTYGVETVLPEYELEGYLFEGWYTSPTFEDDTKVEKMTETDIEDKVLYAKVTIQEYTINFEENGGTEVENITSEYESTIELPESTKDGYTFEGWYSDELLENKFEATTMPGSDTTLYAKWTANEYGIEYYNGEIKLEGLEPTTYVYNVGTTLPTYEVEGYTFEGWYTTNTFEDDTKVESITETDLGDKVLYAKMVANKYTIIFEENGGVEVENITADYESEITLPEVTRDGYTFDNWYIDELLENKFEESTMPSSDITLYAKWTEATYEISYYKGNVKLEGIEPTSYTYGVGSTLPTEIEGYTLEGWYTTDTFDEGTKVESITETDFGNKVLYGNMTINEYKLTFIENDGSEVEDITGEFGTTIELPTPTKEGHILEGWYTTDTFDEGTKFELTTIPGSDLTLYAKWNINVYNITWVDGDGEIIYTEEYEYNQTPSYFEQMGEPTKTSENKAVSYEFKGWSPQIVPATSNRIYSAQFDEIIAEYDITYYDDNYNFLGLTPNTYIYGVGTELPTYEKEGYKFEGWYTSSEFKEEDKVESISETDSGDKELFAKLTAKQYTISFEENSGSEVTDITADYNSEIELPTPTLDGYTLEGWYTTQNFDEGTKFESTTMPAENVTLYAKWEVTQYTITFEENGGTEVEDITGLSGTDVIVPIEPTKEGHTFDGWYSEETFENKYEFSVMPSENITLYAKWNVNKYTINFEENGGSEVENITEDYGTEVMAPTEPTKEGNVFDGWYSDIDLTTPYEFTTMPGSDITLYAKWFTNEYTITFNTLGGSEIEPITKAYGTEITAPEIPTREYSSFIGWYTDTEYTTEFEFTTMPAEDIILYAKWDVEKFTITYANPDGSVIYTEEVEYATIPEYDETTYGIPTYDKVGHTTIFKNWDKEFVMAEEDTTYTALYEEIPNDYSIEYYYGETKLEGMTPTNYTYGNIVELPEYTLEYYTFNGWYTSNTFEEDTKVESITEVDHGDKVLYAKMVINQYTISFEEDGGTEVTDITADYNSPVEKPVDPTKEGYTFDNWYSDETLENVYEFTTMPAEDITLYAKWNINEYTITFEENGGTEVTDITADYNSPVEKPVNPTREHYTFDNWYIDEELTTPYEFSVMPLDGITLYAKWIGDPHTITWSNIDDSVIYTEEVEYGTLPSYNEETYGVPTYTKDGYTYTFKGWDKEITEVTGDTTYKAQYDEVVNTYNIEYYYGETKLEGIEPTSYVYGIGIELKPYELEGYRFEGWYTTNTFEEGTKVERITETDLDDKVLYAKLVRSEFTITFEENGGSEVTDITKTAGEEITAPETTKAGYVFEGWYTEDTLENKYEFSVMPEENITLYAKWSEITIEVVNKEIEMFVDEEVQIEINKTPEEAILTFTYTPLTENVSVTDTGLIKGLTEGETTVTVKVVENPSIEETITVKVNSKNIESQTYSVEEKEDVKIIIGMDEGITIEELLNTLKNKDYINVYDKEDVKITDYTQVISTGLKIKLEKEEETYDQVTIILRGDINEDGLINITDNLILQEHILLITTIEDYRKYAAEIVVDDVINITDKVKLADYILKKIDSLN